ncbi:hypothetical protein GOV09_05515 [Candidatus Woesearchaeota archaeon]|nr:hypothetical protein [Candidatus Woesearchaeota archaeon]
MKWECSNCQYVLNKEEFPDRCPYCGEKGTMGKVKSAQDIIDGSKVERLPKD